MLLFVTVFLYFMTFYISGKLAEAIDHLTEAIVLNPTTAILYSARGIFLNEIYWIHSGYLLCPSFQALSHHLFHLLETLHSCFQLVSLSN